jgi:CelD/BcsL family acetyltransferase involved in cellulose biosynthesis
VLDDWDAYQRRFDSKRLREFRRRRRRLEELGEVVVEISDGSQRLDELLADGFRVEAAGWKSRERTAINSRSATRAFYTEVARWAMQRGWLRLAFLRVGGRAIAFDYCFEQGDVHYLVKTGYDPEFLAYGPGMLLRYEMLARAFSMNFRLYDFLGTNEPWKREWTDLHRERIILEWFASTPAGRVNQAFRAYAGPVYRRLRGAAKEAARR